jgi:hypothetical protein
MCAGAAKPSIFAISLNAFFFLALQNSQCVILTFSRGWAQKAIFLCRYLHSQELRREIHEGLNVVEQWNGATDFVFFARRGEMASNRREDHEISMLALHLIQNCMVYINTLMIQRVLAQPHWQGRLTPRDYAALTPLIWEHVNPYGRFDLDMESRLLLD